MNIDISMNPFNIIAAILLFSRQVYWFVLEIEANTAKPKTRQPKLIDYSKRYAFNFVTLLIIFQLLGIQVVPFGNNLVIQVFGLILTIIGVVISIMARRDLGTNWAHAAEFQIRRNQVLVTHGIYKYIRHPIYSGMMLSIVGAELVAGSYLFVVLFIILLIFGYRQALQEEELLIRQFGKRYLEYMKTSTMFLPRIW